MAAEQSAIYVKTGSGTGSAVALETAHAAKYDHWSISNSHASQLLSVTINGSAAFTVLATATTSIDITASPEVVTVKDGGGGSGTTYQIIATGK